MTALYTTSMGIFAALASGVSIPIAIEFDLGWRIALLIWFIPVLFAIGIWFYLSRKKEYKNHVSKYTRSKNNRI